jgi:hypothetical protein
MLICPAFLIYGVIISSQYLGVRAGLPQRGPTGAPAQAGNRFELFRRAILNRDQAAWQAIHAQYQTLITSWVWRHSKFQSTNEEAASFVNAAFIRFWRTVSKKGMGQFLATLKSSCQSC